MSDLGFKKEFLKIYQKEINVRAEEIDPDEQFDWRGITLGWALGKGMTIEEADRFSRHIRYKTNMAG